MAGNKADLTVEALAALLEAVESRQATQASAVLQLQSSLTRALADFGPVAARVAELSSGFQAANARLAEVQETLAGITDQTELAAQVQAIRASLEGMEARVTGIETTRARSGRLGNRLAGIEEKLARLIPEPPDGGTP
jgi:hypothetical protein